MSTVKANKFSPQSLPIAQIDGFNDVESFVVGSGQTSFDSTKFTRLTPVRAFKRNDVTPDIWDELTLTWTDVDTFTIAESYGTGDEILVFGISGYTSENQTSDGISNESTNTEFNTDVTLTDVIDSLGASAKREDYTLYGIGGDPATVDLVTSETQETGIYTLVDSGFVGTLFHFKDGTSVKQIYFPFGNDQVQTRSNSGGSFSEFKPAQARGLDARGGSFTLDESDAFKYIACSSANPIDVTVPDSATHNYILGTTISLVQRGAGQLSILAGTGVTINAPSDRLLAARTQHSRIELIKTGTDEWDLSGDLASV